MLGLLTRYGHLLTGHDRIGDLVATLLTRTQSAPASVDMSGLHALLPAWTITPGWGLPDAHAAQTRVLEGHRGEVHAVAFSPDGYTIATASNDQSVRLWNVVSASQTAVLAGHSGPVSGVAFAPDGRTLATAGADKTVRLWNVASTSQTAVLAGHHDWVRAVMFSPDVAPCKLDQAGGCESRPGRCRSAG